MGGTGGTPPAPNRTEGASVGGNGGGSIGRSELRQLQGKLRLLEMIKGLKMRYTNQRNTNNKKGLIFQSTFDYSFFPQSRVCILICITYT